MERDILRLLKQKEADFESDMRWHIYQFLKEDNKCFSIVEGAVIYVMANALAVMNATNQELCAYASCYKDIEQYLGANCHIDLLGETLTATSTTKIGTNLLVCHIQSKQVDLSYLKTTVIPRLKEESKKLIIVSTKNVFNDLKKLDCGTFLLIDEFNRKIPVDQYWTLYQNLTFGFMDQLGKPGNCFNVNEPLHVTNEFPIHKAIKEGHINVIYFLLASGANLRCLDKNGKKPFELALENGDEDVISVLLYKLKYNQWYKFLETAVKSGKIQQVKLILQRNFDLNENEIQNKTVLHQSVIQGNLEIVELLVRKGGADVNVLDSEKNTPLHLAVIHKHLDIVKYLVPQCADINSVNLQNKTALDLCICPLVKGYLYTVKAKSAPGPKRKTYKWSHDFDSS